MRLLRVQPMRNGTIDLAQSKTGNDQQWEIAIAVQAILDDEAAKRSGRTVSLYVFSGRRGTPVEPSVMQMRRRAVKKAGLSDLQFRDIRKATINEAKRRRRNATEFAGHSDPKTTKKH
jgi:integrase